MDGRYFACRSCQTERLRLQALAWNRTALFFSRNKDPMELPSGARASFIALTQLDWVSRLADDALWRCRVILEEDRPSIGSVFLPIGTEWNFTPPKGEVGRFSALLDDLIAVAEKGDATLLRVRYQQEEFDEQAGALLEAHGFRRTEDRCRFRRRLDDGTVPEPEGRLVWRTLDEFPYDEVCRVMDAVAVGDPGHDPADRAELALPHFLGDTVLRTTPDVVALGFDAETEQPVAFLCAQVNPRSGWGRIAYMGIVPEWRGRRLGKEVHREGLAMLRRQGGTHYEGGTEIANRPMQALFLAAGCEQFGREFGYARTIAR